MTFAAYGSVCYATFDIDEDVLRSGLWADPGKKATMRRFVLLMAVLLLGVCFPASYPTRADTIDYDIPNGHFYTQAVAPKTPAG